MRSGSPAHYKLSAYSNLPRERYRLTAFEYDHEIALFHHIHAVDVVSSSRIFCTLRLDGRKTVQSHHSALIVVVFVAGRLGCRAAVCFIDLARKLSRILDLTHSRVGFLAQVVRKFQPVNTNGLSKVIRRRDVVLRVFLCSVIRFREDFL